MNIEWIKQKLPGQFFCTYPKGKRSDGHASTGIDSHCVQTHLGETLDQPAEYKQADTHIQRDRTENITSIPFWQFEKQVRIIEGSLIQPKTSVFSFSWHKMFRTFNLAPMMQF